MIDVDRIEKTSKNELHFSCNNIVNEDSTIDLSIEQLLLRKSDLNVLLRTIGHYSRKQ